MAKAVILDQNYPSPNSFSEGREGENKYTLETLKICLKRLPNYWVWGRNLEWTDYFHKCIIMPNSAKDEVFIVNPLYIIINVKTNKLFDVLNIAKQLLIAKIKQLGGVIDE